MCFGGHQMSVLMEWGGGPQINKFEQVLNDSHRMSLAEGLNARGRAPISGRHLYSEVQYIISNVHMIHPLPEQNDKETPVKTLPYRNFIGRRQRYMFAMTILIGV